MSSVQQVQQIQPEGDNDTTWHPKSSNAWEKLGANYFSFAGKDHLLVINYFSKYLEVACISSRTAEATVSKMKQIFSRHDFPNTLVADNMPFNSKAFKGMGLLSCHL